MRFYTAQGSLFGTLSSLDVNDAVGEVRTATLPGIGTFDNLVMQDYAALQGEGLGLSLDFASPFNGVGAVIPFSLPLTRVSSIGATDIAVGLPFIGAAISRFGPGAAAGFSGRDRGRSALLAAFGSDAGCPTTKLVTLTTNQTRMA